MRGTVRDRFDAIAPLLRGRSVLDVGCADSRPDREDTSARMARPRRHKLLFPRIAEVNPDAVGVDLDAEGVRLLRERGHNALCENAETMDLGRTFDTIVAGEIIEHVDNPGALLRNLARHLAEGGTLVLSTPNPFYAANIRRIVSRGRPRAHEDHIAWFDPVTLSAALRRAGLRAVEGYWVQPRRRPSLLRLLRRYFSHSFMILARHQDPAGPRPEADGENA
jgi:2-polyprenyl-3-methyl-5-hydroxy-6-metoxy-1,4-benzoquinol methylase